MNKPCRIGIDARLVTYRRGIGNLVYNLLSALVSLSSPHTFFIYVDDRRARDLVLNHPRFVVRVHSPKLYPLWEQVSLPLVAARDQLDILHCPANTAPLALTKRVKLVLTIHDVMYLIPTSVLPESPLLRNRLSRYYRRLVVPLVARRAATIVTVSHYSRRDIVKYLNVDESKVRVVGEAPNNACRIINNPDRLAAVRARYGLSLPFILALGAMDPRKNTARIMEAYAHFRKRGTGGYQLALVGLPSVSQNHFRQLSQTLGIADEVVLTGFVPEEDLVALYNAAEVLLYPSLYEGFGLPVLEAMACGTPVITSPNGSLPEVAGDAALMVNPLSVEEIANGLLCLAGAPALRQNLIAKGHAQTQKFSWRQAAMQTLDVYQSVLD